MDFKNKTVVITGAGSGIGRSTAILFAMQGANVVVSDINEKGGIETVELIKNKNGSAIFIKCNVAKYDEVENLMNKTVEHFGSIDVAVNNAGIGGKSLQKTAEHPFDDWDRVIAVNQTGVFYCMKLEIQQMLKQGYGNIINIASIAGLRGLPNNLSYVASKHAVVGMTKTAALEYARKNIRVNAVCPVFTHSALFQQLLDSKEGLDQKLKMGIPMSRFGQPEEIGEAILWLTSDKSKFITGHALPVDGGMMA
jgi:NAD(P)-dependent dehydrogenase (short-subunit alcohol dehydrogenase family)